MELASTIRDEFLTCNICLEGYKRPKQLPCLHTFCLSCLNHYITQTVGASGILSVPCPVCRRPCVPPDPNPRKLDQWAGQFPDNFFVASLRETVETVDNDDTEAPGAAGQPQGTRYFMGEVITCNRHLTRPLTRFCLSTNAAACEQCLEDGSHAGCQDSDHLEEDASRTRATGLLEKYRADIDKLNRDITDVKQSFGRKPRQLQMRKEEAEISIGEHFSALRSACAKLLLAKERDMIAALGKVVEEERERTSDGQKKCDDVSSSLRNTVSLFDTLTRSGPFNAMHVLTRVEGQIASTGRLLIKLDQEAKASNVIFHPSPQSLEEHVASFSMGEIVTEFGSEGMTVSSASPTEEGATAGVQVRDGSVTNLESQMSDLLDQEAKASNVTFRPSPQSLEEHVAGFSMGEIVAEFGSEGMTVSSASPTEEGATAGVQVRDGSVTNLESQMSDLQLSDHDSVASLQVNLPPPAASPSGPGGPDTGGDSWGWRPPSSPSAPPMSALEDPADASQLTSSAVLEAFQRSLRKDVRCIPVLVFSGNLRTETRRGGICGAAKVDQPNRAAFVDRHNHSVKIIDVHNAQVVAYLHLGELEPWDITFISERKDLVVTCPGSCYLLFIPSQERKLEIAYYYKLQHGYCCIAHLKENQFMGGICNPFGQAAVHVFDTTGVVLREILPGQFSYPRTIFADSRGSQIIISDWTSNAVFLVNSEGQLISRHRDSVQPRGVAISELTNQLHVVDGKWARLYLLDFAGHCIGVGKLEGCRDPRTVMVVTAASSNFPDQELTVVVDGNNAVHVMSLHYFDPPVQSSV